METTTLDIGVMKLTLAELPQSQIVRIMSQPTELKSPVPPEGYTHEQALQNVQSYKEEWDNHTSGIATIGIFREVGTARALATDRGVVLDAEKEQLARLCKRYAYTSPDTLDDPWEIGATLYEMCSQFGESIKLYETELWLRGRAGFLSSERIEEILKSLHSESQQQADLASDRADQPQEPAEGKTKDSIV